MSGRSSRGSWLLPTPSRLFGLFRDREVPTWHKGLAVAAFLYIVFPLDAVPDLTPVIGWLDDLGVGSLAAFFLSWALGARERRLSSGDVPELGAPKPPTDSNLPTDT